MMNKLHLSKRKLWLAKFLHYGGFALMILFALFGSVWAFLGLGPFLIGVFWIDFMYRCPQCRASLLIKRYDFLISEPSCSFCPKCGWKVDIEEEEVFL